MDLLSQHEAFLRAIFDAPDDDTPRLVYADFLQENGDEDRANFIRIQCELAQWERATEPWTEADPRRDELLMMEARLIQKLFRKEQFERPYVQRIVRGFPEPPESIPLIASYQEDLDGLRKIAVERSPEWFGAKRVKFSPDETRLGPVQVDLFLGLPFTQQVTEWDLSGNVEELGTGADGDTGTFPLVDLIIYSVIPGAGVEALARHRGARRITSLDLRNNNLDNDAARALVASPYLDNLKRLQLLEGNRFRGKVWQQVIERFGEDVVG